MWPFNGTVLGGVVGAGKFDGVAGILEQIEDSFAASEIASLVQADVAVGAIGCVESEPTIEPLYRGHLCLEGAAVQFSAIVIRHEEVTRLAIEALISKVPIRVDGLLNDKTKVDRNSLVAYRGAAGIVRDVIGAVCFSRHAGGALVNI